MTYLDNTPTPHMTEPSAEVPGTPKDISADIRILSQELPRDLSESYVLRLPAALIALAVLMSSLIRNYGRVYFVSGERRSRDSLMGECAIMQQLLGLMTALPPQYVTKRSIKFLMRLHYFARRRCEYLQSAIAAHEARMCKIHRAYLTWRISVIHARAFMAALRADIPDALAFGPCAAQGDALIPP